MWDIISQTVNLIISVAGTLAILYFLFIWTDT
jgi:hypothetical protein